MLNENNFPFVMKQSCPQFSFCKLNIPKHTHKKLKKYGKLIATIAKKMLRNFCARTCSFCAKQFFEAPGPVGALWNFVKDAADSLHVIEGMATTSMAVVIIVALWAFVCPGKYKFLSVDAGHNFVMTLRVIERATRCHPANSESSNCNRKVEFGEFL